MFSTRSAHATQRNALSIALQAHAASFDLTAGNPTVAALPYPAAEVLAALDNPAAATYAPDPRGLPIAREAISARLRMRGLPVEANHVFLTSGTSEAYAHLFTLLCDPDDEVLVPAPSYPLFEHLARLSSVNAVSYPLAYDGDWHMNLAALRAAITKKTRAILIVSPNNPTGSYLKRSELVQLESLGLPLICDEVFGDYPLREDSERVPSALVSERALVFSLFGLSKQAALPQWKVSWTCMRGPKALTDDAAQRLELICDTFLSVATPTQHALPRLLDLMHGTRQLLHARLRRNLAQLAQAVSRCAPVTLLDVEGGFYATLRLPRTQSEERWVLDFLELDSVHVQPGYFFDFPNEAYVVLSLLTPEPTFDAGIARILARVEQTVSSLGRH